MNKKQIANIEQELEEFKAKCYGDMQKLESFIASRSLQIKNTIKELPPAEPDSVFNMKIEQEYWYIDRDGWILESRWDNDESDNQRLTIGNIYLTKAAAEFAVGELKVIQEIAKWQNEFDREFVVDWKNQNQEKILIVMSRLGEEKIEYSLCWNHLNIISCEPFSSPDKAIQCVQSIGAERIKKFLFGIEA